jgi:hypothetical protein
VLGLLLVFRLNDQILPHYDSAFEPWANSKFYLAAANLGLVYLAVFINAQLTTGKSP